MGRRLNPHFVPSRPLLLSQVASLVDNPRRNHRANPVVCLVVNHPDSRPINRPRVHPSSLLRSQPEYRLPNRLDIHLTRHQCNLPANLADSRGLGLHGSRLVNRLDSRPSNLRAIPPLALLKYLTPQGLH